MAALPLTLGGCSLVAGYYFARLSEESARHFPKHDPLVNRAVPLSGPIAVTAGSQSVFEPADRAYLLEGLAARLRRRFPSTEGPATVLQVETVRDSSNARPAVVDTVVRVYDGHGSLQSIIRSAAAVDLQQRDRKASIDGLLASLDARLDTLLFRK